MTELKTTQEHEAGTTTAAPQVAGPGNGHVLVAGPHRMFMTSQLGREIANIAEKVAAMPSWMAVAMRDRDSGSRRTSIRLPSMAGTSTAGPLLIELAQCEW